MKKTIFDYIKHQNLDDERQLNNYLDIDHKEHEYTIIAGSIKLGADTGAEVTTFDQSAEENLKRNFVRMIENLAASDIGDFLSYHFLHFTGSEKEWVIEIESLLASSEELGRSNFQYGLNKGYINTERKNKIEIAKEWIREKKEEIAKSEGVKPKDSLDFNQQILLMDYLGIIDNLRISLSDVSDNKLAKVIGPMLGRSVQNTRVKINRAHLEKLRQNEYNLDVIEEIFRSSGLDTKAIDNDRNKKK